MTVAAIHPDHIERAWVDLWPMLERVVRRAPGQPDVLARIRTGKAQLWAIIENGKPIAAVVTQITPVSPDKKCLIWMVAGSRAKEWAADFLAKVAEWARGFGCVALWAAGRKGWAPVGTAHGFVRIPDVDGLETWERKL